MDKHIIIQQLKKAKPFLSKKYGLTELALFGSYSRNEETDLSDIDIMVDYQNPMGLNILTWCMIWKICLKKKKYRWYRKEASNPNILSSLNEI